MRNTRDIIRGDSQLREAWRKLKANKTAMGGLFIILFAGLISVLGANVRPDQTPDANNQNSPISRKAPGFKVQQLKFRKNEVKHDVNFFMKLFFGGEEEKYKYYPMYGYEFEGVNIVIEEFSGFKEDASYEPLYQTYTLPDVLFSLDSEVPVKANADGSLTFSLLNGEVKTEDIKKLRDMVTEEAVITQKFWLGTDKQGRDMLSRLMAGTIISLSVGLISVFISLTIGLLMGALAGYYRGWVDDLIMWIINLVWSIPALLLIISFTLFLGKGFTTVFIAVGLTMWTELARVVRGQILSIREKEFVEAGRALGYTNSRIIWKHVLPNIMGPVIVISASNFASAILIEAGLSYLGIGAEIPMASWGSMLQQHQSYITNTSQAYLAILPGLCIIILVFAFMMLGNGLRDALDTKSVDDVQGA